MSEQVIPWTRDEFEEKLREKGRGYHIHHPFNVMMYEGKLSRAQLQCWVLIVITIRLRFRRKTLPSWLIVQTGKCVVTG